MQRKLTITLDEAGYAAMAADEACEAEALEWSEGTIGDSVHKRGEVWWVNYAQ
jgi:hypothetical protein